MASTPGTGLRQGLDARRRQETEHAVAGARLSLPPRLCDNNLLHLLLAQEAVGPLGDAPGSEPGAPGSGHWPATFLSQLFASARRGFLIGEMGSIHPFFSENILKAWLTATQITSPGLLSPCEWTPQGRKPSGRAESLEAAGMESERSWGGTAPGAQCRQRLVPGGLRALIPPQAGAFHSLGRGGPLGGQLPQGPNLHTIWD